MCHGNRNFKNQRTQVVILRKRIAPLSLIVLAMFFSLHAEPSFIIDANKKDASNSGSFIEDTTEPNKKTLVGNNIKSINSLNAQDVYISIKEKDLHLQDGEDFKSSVLTRSQLEGNITFSGVKAEGATSIQFSDGIGEPKNAFVGNLTLDSANVAISFENSANMKGNIYTDVSKKVSDIAGATSSTISFTNSKLEGNIASKNMTIDANEAMQTTPNLIVAFSEDIDNEDIFGMRGDVNISSGYLQADFTNTQMNGKVFVSETIKDGATFLGQAKIVYDNSRLNGNISLTGGKADILFKNKQEAFEGDLNVSAGNHKLEFTDATYTQGNIFVTGGNLTLKVNGDGISGFVGEEDKKKEILVSDGTLNIATSAGAGKRILFYNTNLKIQEGGVVSFNAIHTIFGDTQKGLNTILVDGGTLKGSFGEAANVKGELWLKTGVIENLKFSDSARLSEGDLKLDGGRAHLIFSGGNLGDVDSGEKVLITQGTHIIDFENRGRLYSDVIISGGDTTMNFKGSLASELLSSSFGNFLTSTSEDGTVVHTSRKVSKLNLESGKLTMNFLAKAELWRPDFDIMNGEFIMNFSQQSMTNYRHTTSNGVTKVYSGDGGLINISQSEGKSTQSTISITSSSTFESVFNITGGTSIVNIDDFSQFNIVPLTKEVREDSQQHFTISGGTSIVNVKGKSKVGNLSLAEKGNGFLIDGGDSLINLEEGSKLFHPIYVNDGASTINVKGYSVLASPIQVSGGTSIVNLDYQTVLEQKQESAFDGNTTTRTFKVSGGTSKLNITGGSLFNGLLEISGGESFVSADHSTLGGELKKNCKGVFIKTCALDVKKGLANVIVSGGKSELELQTSKLNGSILVKGGESKIMLKDASEMTIQDFATTNSYNDFVVLGGSSQVVLENGSSLALGVSQSASIKPAIFTAGGKNEITLRDTSELGNNNPTLNGDIFIGGGETVVTLDGITINTIEDLGNVSTKKFVVSNKNIFDFAQRYEEGSVSAKGLEDIYKVSEDEAKEMMKNSKFTLNLKDSIFADQDHTILNLETPYVVNMYAITNSTLLMLHNSDSAYKNNVTINSIIGENVVSLMTIPLESIRATQESNMMLLFSYQEFEANESNFSIESSKFILNLDDFSHFSNQSFDVLREKTFYLNAEGNSVYSGNIAVKGGTFYGSVLNSSFNGKLRVYPNGSAYVNFKRPDKSTVDIIAKRMGQYGLDWTSYWMPTLQTQGDGKLYAAIQNDITGIYRLSANANEENNEAYKMNIGIDTAIQEDNLSAPPPIAIFLYEGSSAQVFLATQTTWPDSVLDLDKRVDITNTIDTETVTINGATFKNGIVASFDAQKADWFVGSYRNLIPINKALLQVKSGVDFIQASVGGIFAGEIGFFEDKGIGAATSKTHTITLEKDAIFINNAQEINATLDMSLENTKFVSRSDVSIAHLKGSAENILEASSLWAESIVAQNTTFDLESGETSLTLQKVSDLSNAVFRISLNKNSSDKVIIEEVSNVDSKTLVNYLQPYFSDASLTSHLVAKVKHSNTGDLLFEALSQGKQGHAQQGFDDIEFSLSSQTQDLDLGVKETSYFFTLKGSTIQPVESSKAVSAINSNQSVFLANINNLNKRLGELRDNPFSHGSWARIFSGLYEDKTEMKLANQFTNVQVGYDEALSNKAYEANHYIGIALGYGYNSLSSQQDFLNAQANLFELGAYYAFVSDEGFYSDTILKYSFITNRLGFESKNYNIDTQYFSVGEEFGYRFHLPRRIFVEPQAEFILGYSGSNEIERQKQEHFMSIKHLGGLVFRGRVGGVVGYSLPYNTQQTDFRIGLSYSGDFFAESIKLKTSLSELNKFISANHMGTVSFSLNHILSDKFRLYLDIETGFGTHFDEKYLVSFGGRYFFGKADKNRAKFIQDKKKEFAPIFVPMFKEGTNPANEEIKSDNQKEVLEEE